MWDATRDCLRRYAAWVTLLKRKVQWAAAEVYADVATRVFIAFFLALYVVHFIVDALALVFLRVEEGRSLFSLGVAQELIVLFHDVTGHFMESGTGGILTIMLFLILVSGALTKILFAPIKEAAQKQRLFAANASHELRTPLSVLKTLAEVAHMRSANLSPEETRTFAKDINEEVDRMSRIIEFFVRFSALEDGAKKFQMAPVRLSRLAEGVARSLERFAQERSIAIAVAKDFPGVVRGNVTALEELLANLVRNAVTFSPKGGDVRISSKVSGGHVALIVADNGRGIADEDLPHIFEPFYQAGGKKHGAGSGLGLALVKQIAQLHHAKIEVKSKVGAGTTFTVKFPR